MKITPRARQLIQIFHSIDKKLEKATAAIIKKSLEE
jgi:hypothetical protein